MRCSSCGTENEGDSRFCGGCGAKLMAPDAKRVAPTLKVPDDAPLPSTPAPPIAPAGYTSGPPQMPPPVGASPKTPIPASRATPARPRTQPVPEASLPIVRRPWGVIIALLVIDVVLAAVGAVLLVKASGTSDGNAPANGSAASPAPSAAAAPAPTVTPIETDAAGSDKPAADQPKPADTPADTPTDKDKPVDKAPPAKATAKSRKPPPAHHPATPTTAAPEDPYGPSLANEIDLTASRAQPALDACATSAGSPHGDVRVAFQVTTEGRVAHPKAVENTTGSAALARCLAGVIARWTFAAKPARATDFVRPFSYP